MATWLWIALTLAVVGWLVAASIVAWMTMD